MTDQPKQVFGTKPGPCACTTAKERCDGHSATGKVSGVDTDQPTDRAGSCLICGLESMSFAWTDTHGVAQCRLCGAPYRIYHYEDGKRVEKPAECLIADESLRIFRTAWERCKSPMSAVWFSLSFPGGYDYVAGDGGRAFDKCFSELGEAARAD